MFRERLGKPLAGVCWLIALIGFGQWLNDGVEYIGNVRTVAAAPGTVAIFLTVLGIVLWLLSSQPDLPAKDD